MSETEAFTTPRRTMLKTAAWTVPVIAAVAASPLASASPCLPGARTRGAWTSTFAATSGTFSANSGENNWTSTTSVILQSERDNASSTAPAVWQASATITVTPGRRYRFTFGIRANHGSNSSTISRPAALAIAIGGTTVQLLTTTATTGTGAYLPVSAPAGSIQNIPITVNTNETLTTRTFVYTAPAGAASRMLTYTFYNSPTPSGRTQNDDIRVELPTIACGV